MLRIPLPEKDTALLLVPRWGELETPGQVGLLALLFLLPIILVVWLYRNELRLVSRWTAAVLLLLRVLVLLCLWFAVAMQPIVARFGDEEQAGKILIAVDRSQSMDVTDPRRTREEKLRLARALKIRADDKQRQDDQMCDRVDQLTRSDIGRTILGPTGLDLLASLGAGHEVELLGFHQEIWENRKADELFTPAPKDNRGAEHTNLNLPLAQALEQAKQGRVLGVVILTDGQHNAGPSPVEAARELGERKVPIYPLVIGSKNPPADSAVIDVKAPANVFADADVPIEARVKVTGLPAQDVSVELRRKGKTGVLQTKTIQHSGKDRVYNVGFSVRPQEIGTHTFEVKVKPTDPATREITPANNVRAAVVRVAADKARVLLVDGEARWEYHYLSNALLRDRAVASDRVLFVQPRLGLVPEAELEKAGHARLKLPAQPDGKQADPLFAYDCIILGDVDPEQLPLPERRRLERFVSDRGGTLIVEAGKRFMPLKYFADLAADDPLRKLIPVTRPQSIQPVLGFPLKLTGEGKLAGFMQLEPTAEQNAERWSELPRHYWGVTGRPRPGAIVLAVPAEPSGAGSPVENPQKAQGLIVQQNYGLGRVLYVGLESTWRWRYKVGDLYHHRFWGQVVRWAAAGKLLPAGNRLVRYGSREPVYRQGQAVAVAVRLGEDVSPLPDDSKAAARIIRLDKNDEVAAHVALKAAALQPRLLTGQVRDLPAGNYRIELAIPELNSHLKAPVGPEEKQDPQGAGFTVLPPDNAELADLSTNWPLLESLAAHSKGEVLTPEDADKLVHLLVKETVKRQPRQDTKLWQDEPLVWVTLAVVLALLTIEWVGRKLAGLP